MPKSAQHAPQMNSRVEPAAGPMAGPFGHHMPNNMGTAQTSSHQAAPPQQVNHHFQMNTPTSGPHQQQQLNGCLNNQMAPAQLHRPSEGQPRHQQQVVTRLTLPLRDGLLLGPFKLDHGVQYARKVFHIKPQLMETLSKSSMLAANPQQPAPVFQELQFRAYLASGPAGNGAKSLGSGDSLLAPQQQANNKVCAWPEHFQVSVNQQPVHLDRAGPHKPLNLFPFCSMGDNQIEFQVNDCYCSHEFVLELVDRPTLRAFMESCFKSRVSSYDACLSRIKCNFGSPGFVPAKLTPEASQLLQAAGVQSDYVSEFIQKQQANGHQIEQQVTRVRISLRCPLTGRRMRTPTRGPNCKHLQCFDLENFLVSVRDQPLWSCPVCSLPVPFNLLEMDQFQSNVLQAMAQVADTDDVLVDPAGQWQAYYLAMAPEQPQPLAPFHHEPAPLQPSQQQQQQPVMVAKTNGTFHPQISHQPPLGASPIASPMRPLSGNGNRPPAQSNWMGDHLQDSPSSFSRVSPVRRPPSAVGGQATPPGPLAKRAYSSQRSPPQHQQPPPQMGPGAQSPHSQLVVASQAVPASNYFGAGGSLADNEELSPLAAMERTIIQHEQQMGPPPFDPNSLTSSPLRSSAGAATAAAPPPPPSAGLAQATLQTQSMSSPSRPLLSQQSNTPASPMTAAPTGHPHLAAGDQSPQMTSQTGNISTPATPLVHHIGPETPATPGSSQLGQQPPSSFGQATCAANPNGFNQGVDHQPLSNGSASAGSITSSSTMTPSGQSLGSVGMGGDSRCNTAPLQAGLGNSLDGELGLGTGSGGLQGHSSQGQSAAESESHGHQQENGQHRQGQHELMMGGFDDKNEILMSKLMMDSDSESMLQRNNELTLALEEAQWKQQLDRGKSEHLANFLNDPLMRGPGNRKQPNTQYQHHAAEGANKMLSGGLNPSDDESVHNSPHDSSPDTANQAHGNNNQSGPLDQPLDSFVANYLDSGSVDDGAGLPPDDSILDLFER